MKISKDKYDEIIIALDGIRCDNRENKQYSENENDLRPITQDVMQYIERKGYCKYIYGANCRFVRTLTEKGYSVLSAGNYGKYLWKETLKSWAIWLPIFISILAVGISLWDKNKDAEKINKLEQKIKQLETLSKQRSVVPFHLGQTEPKNLKILIKDSLTKTYVKTTKAPVKPNPVDKP